jgi:hypothetical protein
MGGGKGGQSQSPQFAPAQSQADFDYLQQNPDVAASGMNPYWHYQMYGIHEGRQYGQPPPSEESFGMENPFEGLFKQMEDQRQSEYAEQQRLAEQAAEQQRIAEGRAHLDELFAGKLDAANRAKTEVEAQITNELAHAATHGLDYAVTDQERADRINNLFGDYWSEGQETDISNYTRDFGDSKHVWTLPIVRGTKPGSATGALQDVKVGGPVSGPKGGTVLTDEEEDTTAEKDKTLLGV